MLPCNDVEIIYLHLFFFRSSGLKNFPPLFYITKISYSHSTTVFILILLQEIQHHKTSLYIFTLLAMPN